METAHSHVSLPRDLGLTNTVGAKSIFSAKSISSASFNVFLKHLEFSREASFFTGSYSVYSKFKQKQKKQKKLFNAQNTV
jgi:hypothetical protein